MKTKLSLTLLLSLAFGLLSSQVPQGFNYQAVARNASGLPIINQSLPVRMTIQSDSSGGTIFWQELHSSVVTTDQGVINLVIGKGTRQSASTVATFSAIDWSVTPSFLKIEIDYSGWKTLGASRLWSVPYAMVAGDLEGPIDKLAIEGETSGLEEALFEVKNKDGQTVFAVYNEGVRVYVSDGTKAVKGGFAVGGFGTDKAESTKYLFVGKDSVRIYIDSDPTTKKLKGGFAVGGYDMTKGTIQDYLDVNSDSVRIYIDNNPDTKKLKGGFAVGGYDLTKGIIDNYLNVNTDASGIINPSQNKILWYPLKNAFLTGKVLIENKDSVGENSFASGYESKAEGQYSQALGYKAVARGDYSTAIGKNAMAGNINSFAFGENAKASSGESYAFGRGAIAEGFRSFAFGSAGVDSAGQKTGVAYAKGDYSIAIGQGSQTLGLGSFVLGLADTARGDYSIAIGYGTCATGYGATAMGYHTTADRLGTAIGYYANTTGGGLVAMGSNTNASGNGSIAIGTNITSSGYFSTAIGFNTTASGTHSTAFGVNGKANGSASTAMGWGSEASGQYSTAMGIVTTASGLASTAMGDRTTASGSASTAMGDRTTASDDASTAMGSSTIASNYASTAMGYGTNASGPYSTAMGYETNASGTYSTTIGYKTTASGHMSTALGWSTKAKPLLTFVIGMYNDTTCSVGGDNTNNPTDPIFIIGNGYADNVRLNAFTVLKSGRTAIGHPFPTEMLDVNGNARFRNVSSSMYAYNLNLTSDGTLTTATSDISMKENIIHITNALENVTKLRGVYFNWKNEPEMGLRIGFIAQEVEQVIPELVFTNPADGLKGVNYAEMTAVLVEALKEQQQQIESYKSELQTLHEKVDKIETLLAKALGE